MGNRTPPFPVVETLYGESTALDEAFERMASSGFELPNGFVNHGAMACEALAALGFEAEIGDWAARFSRVAGAGVTPESTSSFEWYAALGDYRRLPEWIGTFENAIADEGWSRVVEVWVPRLLPGMATALFHGAIRTSHAVRAVAAEDNAQRRGELARALGYWAARYRPGEPTGAPAEIEDVGAAVLASAGEAARFYLGEPSIYHLHGVTGAMAVHLLAPYVPESAALVGLRQLNAEHTAMYAGAERVDDPPVAGASARDLADAAQTSGDPHQVKLVEASLRALATNGDSAFSAAAEVVTGLDG